MERNRVLIHKEESVELIEQLDMGGGEEEGVLVAEIGNTVNS